MSKYSNLLLSIVLVLVFINLGLTGLVLVQQTTLHSSAMDDQIESLEVANAQAFGEKVSTMYNQQDHQGLYDLFNTQAKIKLSHLQLQGQLKNLFQIFGKIEENQFIKADKIAEKGDYFYYNILFNIRISEARKKSAKLTLVVVEDVSKDKKLSLMACVLTPIIH